MHKDTNCFSNQLKYNGLGMHPEDNLNGLGDSNRLMVVVFIEMDTFEEPTFNNITKLNNYKSEITNA